MPKFQINQLVRCYGKWGGVVTRIITLDAPKWAKPEEQKTRYQYYVLYSAGACVSIVEEADMEENNSVILFK